MDLLRAIVRIGMAREDSVSLGSALDQLLVVEQGEPAAEMELGELAIQQEDLELASRAFSRASPSRRAIAARRAS